MPGNRPNFGLQGAFVKRGDKIAFIANVDSVSTGDGVSLTGSERAFGITTANFTGTRPVEVSITARGLSPEAISIMTGETLTDTDGRANTARLTALRGDWAGADTELTVDAISEVGLYILEVMPNNLLHTTKIFALDEQIVLTPEIKTDTGDSEFVISRAQNADLSPADRYSTGLNLVGQRMYLYREALDPDAPIQNLVYQWQRANPAANPRFADIADEDDNFYNLQQDDVNKYLRAKITYEDAEGNEEVVYTPIENFRVGTGGRINPPLPAPLTFAQIPGVNISVEGLEEGDKAIVEVMPETEARGTFISGSTARPTFSLYVVSDSREDTTTAILHIPSMKLGPLPIGFTSLAEMTHELSGNARFSSAINGFYRFSQITKE